MGPLVRLELTMGGHFIEAEITRNRFTELKLAPGQRVLVSPRQARFFLQEGWQGTNFEEESLRRLAATFQGEGI
jgi:hypothetical protein